ncbi:hypothetical protein [Moheibacter sediminis]|uniref:hypothetical protein n=1 Tax=Moheibacter sediminis TaxID=1434700 RepID=UPI000A01576D|nr:hypothetical protein [Moheibacter sediminis]
MNLYLYDLRPTPEGFERVYDYEEFVAFILKNGLSEFTVHSQNPAGKENIETLLNNLKKFQS